MGNGRKRAIRDKVARFFFSKQRRRVINRRGIKLFKDLKI